MFHESFHILFDEQPLSFRTEFDQWFKQNPSKKSLYASMLYNEAITTCLANGYFHQAVFGKYTNDKSWYNNRYISDMAKAIYPMLKEYIKNNKPVDRAFIDSYIKIYDEQFPSWFHDIEMVMMQRFVISADINDLYAVLKTYRYNNFQAYEEAINKATISEMKEIPVTKLIFVKDAADIQVLKENFLELADWKPDLSEKFVFTTFLKDKSYLIIIHKDAADAQQLLKSIQIKP